MKKGWFGVLAAIFVITMVFVELASPFAQAADTYTVSITNPGEKVTKSNFKGYAFNEECKTATGKTMKLRFYSNKPLKEDKAYRLVIQDNNMVTQTKELNDTTVVSAK
ncbi:MULTISPECIES: YxeA family protein [Listeria]|uniref:YxeA family protein n=1 Tax=Listeria TaxID=1637 RepID=UPI000B58B321|nr:MULTISPECIES: YxeA family protein [Listeria]